MQKYKTDSIGNMMKLISQNEVYLPAIQRKFVWSYDQIEMLFDSIMRGYPIGTFLFWSVVGATKDDYTFYKFIHNYHERDNYLNEIAPKPDLKDKIIGVLDGQQRLSSMYIALQGTYAYKKKHYRVESDKAYPPREMYLNLFQSTKLEDGLIYEFRFLEEEDGEIIDENQSYFRFKDEKLWFKVKEVLTWGLDPDLDKFYDDLVENPSINTEIVSSIKEMRQQIKKRLRVLHNRLIRDDLINYFELEQQDLDKILDIFVRVNSGGTPLSKSDLLFSTIVARWEEARNEIDSLLKNINQKGDGFSFDNDFIMRACLVLTDSQIVFTVKSFKKANIEKITENWEQIKSSIENMVDLLVEFGINEKNLTSLNATIPIAYYLLKGGQINKRTKHELKIYLIQSLLQKVYGGQGDSVLTSIRDAIRTKGHESYILRNKDFEITDFVNNLELPGNKRFKIDEEDIEDLLETKKGPYTFLILSLLYPNLKYGLNKWHQDHIHPASSFTNAKLKKYGIPEENWKHWQLLKDQLPNLQIMEGSENESKNKTPFNAWLHGKNADCIPNVRDIDKFLLDNYIPLETSLEFEDFENFFEKRKGILRDEIKKRVFLSQSSH
ncbi:DUF262 domain-containing protein [Methanobacterium sp.]|uniref:DUF262 domain-containing protein n=1 Tax=Methanobacterium sp. TaxID=2164 RepID=UPI0025CD67FF|nr:DUF262 domain-containing protein [Methanobacterium sp.]MBI5459737.1 DUF262 domain-containing protein [Methanobacterium sp.]